MFPTFIGILDIQSWWEVPSIAHFCSLFRAAFNLLDFDIEDLEEALLTDGGTEGRLVQELIVKLLEGCLPNDTRNDISTFNYQMFLRRLFRKKCQEYKCENPFNTDVDFELLPLRQKVEILRALCDFRLDAEDVEQSLSNLDSDSLRVEPLGHDRKNSAYWYFYGTRLYREDYIDTSVSTSFKQSSKSREKKRKKRRNRVAKKEEEEEEKEENNLIYKTDKERESVWQVVCFTQQDWSRLVEKFRDSEYDTERKLYRTLSEDFMPEIPKLFDLKEKQQRRKLLQRNNSRVLRSHEPATQMETVMVRSKIKTKNSKGAKRSTQSTKNVYVKDKSSPPLSVPPIQKKGRQTNNSLASAVGQIVIHTRDEVENLEKKKGISSHGDNYVTSNYGYKYGYSFGIEEEERRVGMHKVLESLKDHVDVWPFIDPVDEEYAPRYYSVVRRPMDLSTMEEKLEGGSYKSISQFKRDFRLIVDNCRQYNGSDNEYTEMAINLKEAFDKAVNRYLESETSSDEDLSSTRSVSISPSSLSYPLNTTSPSTMQHNVKKSLKKSNKRSKSIKSETRAKSKISLEIEEEKQSKNLKFTKKKRGKRKSKKIKEEDIIEEEEEEGEEEYTEIKNEKQEQEIKGEEADKALSDVNVVKSKGKKHINTNNVLLKTKKLPPKEQELKRANKKNKHQQKKDAEIIRSVKEGKKRKEDFEESYEPSIIAKSKSRKIEKKELENTLIAENTKKCKLKRVESQDNNTEKSLHVKVKKNRKKEKDEAKMNLKSDEEFDGKILTKEKEKEKKSKQKTEENVNNGELTDLVDSKELEIETNIQKSKQFDTCKKLAALVNNKDLESLDSLKDKVSERRREEKLKHEKEKQKKKDIQSAYSKKVPSNGSTLHDGDKVNLKRLKSKKGVKEEKSIAIGDINKCHNHEVNDSKKTKNTQVKHTKVFGKEESSAIQALNQATEQTLNDINKWLDDAPRLSEFSSGSDSPVFHSSIESNKSGPKLEAPRKRPSSIKIFGPHGPSRPKKIQRTIDRLQPGKSKGNLLLKKPLNLSSSNISDTTVHQSASDNVQPSTDVKEEPKLSLGTVLKNADSIQLICKGLVSSPNPNFSNDDEEEDHTTVSVNSTSNAVEEKLPANKGTILPLTTVEETKDSNVFTEEIQKQKSTTPNLSAWFKAFGAPKSKKKDEEIEEGVPKKDGEIQETICSRPRRMSTGGSSLSESLSSFSQESPPGRCSGRSPQNQPVVTTTETQNHPLSPAYPSPASYEQTPIYPQIPSQTSQVYQKSSPQENSSEAYRQLSPTFPQCSPQNNFPQSSSQNEPYPQQISSNNQTQSAGYSQHSPQPLHPVYSQTSPQAPSNYSQPSPQQSTTPKYSQPSPQQNSSINYSQNSPQATSNFSHPSPQQQHSPYSQSSPQASSNYSRPSSPQQHSSFSQSSPQQSSVYSRTSPQPPPVYSQQPTQSPHFSQPSPQTHSNNFSQPSPQPIPPYSQPSPKPQNFSQSSPQQIQTFSQHSPQTPPAYSQSSPQAQVSYSQPSPQNNSYSQPSPQQPPNYSQPSPQQPPNYSQPSPQQAPNYSHPLHSPQTPPNYSQLSPQQQAAAISYPQPSPQSPHVYSQPSPQQKSVCTSQQQSTTYLQSPPQQATNYAQSQPPKAPEDYTSNTIASSSYAQNFKQTHPYLQSPTLSVNESERRQEFLKSNNSDKTSPEEQRNFIVQPESSMNLNANHQIYQPSNQFPTAYPNNFSNSDIQRSSSRHSNQEPSQQQSQHQQQQQPQQTLQERPNFTDLSDSVGVQKYTQQRPFLSKNASTGDQIQAQDQSQLIAFQQNLTTHESLYQTGFQPSGYPITNSRPVYHSPHYFDASSKTASGGTSNTTSGNLPPVKKRVYNESPNEPSRALPQESTIRTGQEQFIFDPMIALSQPEAVSASQFESVFVGSLADSVATSPAYARLGLGLVSRTNKEQQLLTIPRPPPAKPEHLAYARSPVSGTAELDLNLLQSIQSAAAKNTSGILSMSRRVGETTGPPPAPVTTRTKKSKKSKQQQQEQPNVTALPSTVSGDQQASGSISNFSQYSGTPGDIGLKNTSVIPPGGSAFNFAAPTSTTTSSSPFYDKDASAAAAAFAFLDEFRNTNSYYSMALRQQQQQQQQQQQVAPVTDTVQSSCNKLSNQSPRNYPPHPFLHSAQRSAAYGPHVSAYVPPHGPNLTVDPAAYQQYIHSLYALQPPHHHRPSWL
ncbi:protein split ends-like isoform X2 [Vespa mandarinia]|uniref:protein split ends-like isoform X2 n=1 Tax=Vespa mandarinia TaxID=7446 RepID=UPI001618B521|nr:protein split ends-like isoform X2 [Vespa mandarinia]